MAVPTFEVTDLSQFDHRTAKAIRDDTMLDMVPVRKMFVDAYGRPLNQRKVNELRRNFDRNALGVILLSWRHDTQTYAILDGHHRKVAAEQEGIYELPARIYIDQTYEQEAELYNRFASVHKQTALDRFRARIEAKEPGATAIRSTFLKHGLDIAVRGKGIGCVEAVDAIEQIERAYGIAFLDDIVGILQEAWGTSARAWVGQTLKGLAAFWIRYRDYVERPLLIEKLQLTTPEVMIGRATGYRPAATNAWGTAKCWGVALKEHYDAKMRRKLPEWKDNVMGDAARERVREGAVKQRGVPRDRRKG